MREQTFNRTIELAKLIISVIVPVIIGLSAFFIQKRIGDYQSHQMISKEVSVKLADRRLSVYDQIKNPLNQIYRYIEEVGDWENLSAEDMRKVRREIHVVMYSNMAIWSPETFRLYVNYIDDIAFEMGEGPAKAKVNAEKNQERLSSSGWKVEMDDLITGKKSPLHKEKYHTLNEALASDLLLSVNHHD
ncbi:hypothetical protein FKD06_24425 [Serratia sp. SRS-8-S-2018]|uniref:hypothetical protein n=1 Tax=Serratia sp. SRS-8-S-2018 TaxID=2591107 RepID=UPI00113FDBEA|nr:hypothetical protein [Serratia sp. SRS-8-S-2018]TPW41102.1 hypothetical protein FKD06_24425 [Serratia sp. SRS-8-S-2018]